MKGVIVGIDGSAGARTALRFAADEARLRGVTLHVIATWHVPAMAYAGGGIDDLPRALQDGASEAIEESLASLGDVGELTIERHVIEGNAVRVMADAAKDADLLVVGSRGLGGVGRVLLGSVSSALAHQAPCPVAIVPHVE